MFIRVHALCSMGAWKKGEDYLFGNCLVNIIYGRLGVAKIALKNGLERLAFWQERATRMKASLC